MIRLEQFATGATKAVEGAINDAKAAGATGIVLDLRANPGGYVNEAIGVASQFVGDGIVYQASTATGVRKDAPVSPGGPRDVQAARRARRRQHRELRGDRHRRDPGRRRAAGRGREDVRHRDGARAGST